jgi:opacity protein-like surface antigen
MTKPAVVIALTIAMVVVAASAQAQDGPQQSHAVTGVEITPFVSLGSNASSGVGAAVRWPLGSNFSLEVETAGRWSEVTALSAGVSLLFDLPTIGQATPYVAAGIGLDQYGFPVELPGRAVATQTGTTVTVNAGGGVRVPVAGNWGMRTDARWSNGIGSKAPERWRLYNGVTFSDKGR